MTEYAILTPDDAFDLFAELPPRVQVAVGSLLQGFQARQRIGYYDYPRPVAEVIRDSGLVDVALSDSYAHFAANTATRALMRDRMRWLKLMDRL